MADEGEKQIIEIEYVVRADTAIANAEKMQSSINAIKIDIQQLAASSEASFANIAAGMKKAFSSDIATQIKQIKTSLAEALKTEVDPEKISIKKNEAREQIKELLAARREYNEYVNKALAQLNAAEIKYSKESMARERERTNQKKALIKEERDALAEYSRAKAGDVLTPAAQAMGAEVQKVKAEISALAAQNNKSFTQIGQDMVNKGQRPAQLVKQAIRELNTELKNTTSAGGGFIGFLQSLGTVGQAVFGFTLGTLAVQALRNVVRWFQEAARAGFDYAKALARLEISTQILQEGGLNVSMQETLDLITRLNQEFPIFTRKQIIEGVGYIQLLSQNLQLSKEQMEDMAEVSSALAVVLGKDVNDAARELALFLSSGYGEALQRAGILASKQAVVEELRRMGIKAAYNDVDQATRAQAGYNVIMRDAIAITEKAKEIQDENAFAATKAENAWKNLKETIGIRLTPVLTILYNASVKVAEGLLKMNQKWLEFSAHLNAIVTTAIPRMVKGLEFLAEATKNAFNPDYDFGEAFKKFSDEVTALTEEKYQENLKKILPDIFTDFEDSAIGAGSAVNEAAATIGDAVESLYDDIKNESERFASDMARIERDLQNDLEKIDRDANVKRGESWLEYFADIAAIWRKAYDDIVAENIKFQLDLAQLNRDFDNKREDANQKYRDKEYKAQKDFEEKMRRLREEFLFDLEDALRERDARQVLRLIRRFNLEQARLERERDSEREDRQREYRRELDDIERQRAERLQRLNEEHQARLEAIKRQEAIELRELQIKHEAELAEIDRRLALEKEERRIRAEEQREELKTQFEDRIRELGEGLVEEYGVTKEMLDAIGAAYMATYGPNGVMQRALDYALGYLAQSIITMNSIAAGFGGYGSTATYPMQNVGEGFSGIPGYATGAQNMLVTSPQIIQVGEIPEMINITPLNRMSSSDMGGKDGTIAIELWLSPDLQARVMDNTLDAVATIMLDHQRRR